MNDETFSHKTGCARSQFFALKIAKEKALSAVAKT